MDPTKKALDSFRKPYSCAQTVYAAFTEAPDEETLARLKSLSGGRAENNACGALYAAKELVDGSECDALEKEFAEAAGSCKCKELKLELKTPCEKCVEIAATLVQKFKRKN